MTKLKDILKHSGFYHVMCLIILVQFISSCKENKAIDIAAIDIPIPNEETTDDNRIVGEWTMCTTTADNVNVQMNICPTVMFKSNGEGMVKNSDVVSEVFQWKFSKGRLAINYPEEELIRTFSDSLFAVNIAYHKGIYDVNIRAVNNQQSIYLKKSNKYADVSAEQIVTATKQVKHSFSEFPVEIYMGEKAVIDFTSNIKWRKFEAEIAGQYISHQSLFSGHYNLIKWGCGTACKTGVIVDFLDGKIYDLPTAELNYSLAGNSSLLIINHPDSVKEYDYETTAFPLRFWHWNNKANKIEELN
jgi:hypothetical protein